MLKKYKKAQVVYDDEGGGFDARYNRSGILLQGTFVMFLFALVDDVC